MHNKSYDANSDIKGSITPNSWDFLALIIIFAILVAFSWSAMQMSQPFSIGESLDISLDPANLPNYGIRTVIRMLLALILSLFFTFTIGTLAAKNHAAERIIIPLIDILQAVPVLSFLSITIVSFIALFPGNLLGPECAAIFAIFTSQAWNMSFGFYQSLKSVPQDLREVAKMYHLSAWQQFWKIEVPHAMPSLLWNMMMSMSASWFFVVASEAISVARQDIKLPGIGSYIALAIEQTDMHGVCYAIIAMLLIILFYDQLLFRPLLFWSQRYEKLGDHQTKEQKSWFISLLQKTQLLRYWSVIITSISNAVINGKLFNAKMPKPKIPAVISFKLIWLVAIICIGILGMQVLVSFIVNHINLIEVLFVVKLGFFTMLRVILMIIISSIIWVPVGVWIGLRPSIASKLQSLIQFLASFPAYLLFPLVVITIVKFNLNVEIWTMPLMMLGSQWYILFNVIAGTIAIPQELHYATKNIGLVGRNWWLKFILPALFPFYITGAITAAGAAWNASIVAELVYWGNITLKATGLGAYIAEQTTNGDFARITLGTVVMCIYVLLLNKVVWQPLYKLAEKRI